MSLIKSKKRVADHGEVFTPPWLVDAMLDLVKDETDRIDSRFLEPACGSDLRDQRPPCGLGRRRLAPVFSGRLSDMTRSAKRLQVVRAERVSALVKRDDMINFIGVATAISATPVSRVEDLQPNVPPVPACQ